MNTALFLLRAVQLGVTIADLNLLTIGLVNDMYIELHNDHDGDYAIVADQEDIDNWFGK